MMKVYRRLGVAGPCSPGSKRAKDDPVMAAVPPQLLRTIA